MSGPTPESIARDVAKINAMGHEAMCRLYRFATPGHPWFQSDTPQWAAFDKRFREFGGFTPEISKRIGWDA